MAALGSTGLMTDDTVLVSHGAAFASDGTVVAAGTGHNRFVGDYKRTGV